MFTPPPQKGLLDGEIYQCGASQSFHCAGGARNWGAADDEREAIGVNTGSVNRFTMGVAGIWIVACLLHAILMTPPVIVKSAAPANAPAGNGSGNDGGGGGDDGG